MTAAVGERTRFYGLRVDRIDRVTGDAVAITFDVPDELHAVFAFRPGQSLTVRHGDERRSYSICAPAGAAPRIGVREVPGGAVSGWLVRDVRPGDVIDALPPGGSFSPALDAGGRHVLIGAGSGITPLLSIASSLLAATDAELSLIYGNRRSDTVMFADELADLKDAHPTRFQLVHVLSREAQDVELFSGRLDADRLRRLLPALVDVADTDHWWLCGPFGMVTAAMDVLAALGVDRSRIHRELFYVEDVPPAEVHHVDAAVGPGSEVSITLDGRTSTLTVPAGVPILDGAQRLRPDLPFACKGGVCGTCRARVISGKVEMRRNFALEDDEVAAGYVLTCQGVPISGEVVVDYDA